MEGLGFRVSCLPESRYFVPEMSSHCRHVNTSHDIPKPQILNQSCQSPVTTSRHCCRIWSSGIWLLQGLGFGMHANNEVSLGSRCCSGLHHRQIPYTQKHTPKTKHPHTQVSQNTRLSSRTEWFCGAEQGLNGPKSSKLSKSPGMTTDQRWSPWCFLASLLILKAEVRAKPGRTQVPKKTSRNAQTPPDRAPAPRSSDP